MDISFVTRKIQRSIAGLSVLALLASLVSFTGTAFASTFPDVDSDHFASDYVAQASDEGWMTGYDNGDFGVNDNMTRAQAAKVLVLAFDFAVDTSYDAGFDDVSPSNTLEDYINTAALYGIVSGYTDADGVATGMYGPNDPLRRAEYAKMVVDAAGLTAEYDYLGIFPDVASGQWYTYYVETAYMWSVIGGYTNGNFGPGDYVTRGQAAKMTVSAMSPEYRSSDPTDPGSGSDEDATLEVSLSSDSPDSMTIPSKATSVVLGVWDFSATGGDVELDDLVVHQYGITSLVTTHQVYVYEGSDRLTTGKTINTTSNEATFTNLNLAIDKGETRTLSLRMDMGSTAYSASAEVGVELESASAVDAGAATVEGDFPLRADKHTISTTAVGTITIEKNGTVTNAKVGEDGATIAKFKLSADTEAANLSELGLYLSGSVNTGDVENFELFVSGDDATPIATVDAVDSNDVVRFVVEEGYAISKGASKSFYVTADFNTGRTSDTVKAYVDQDTDVVALGNLYGFGMAITRSSYDGNAAPACASASSVDCNYMSLEGGDITITSSGPSASDIAVNADDATVLNFTIVSVTDVTFDSFPIKIDTSDDTSDTTEGLLSTAAANFTDVKIMNTDTGEALYAGVDSTSFKSDQYTTATVEGTDSAAGYYLYTDDFEMAAGEELNLALSVDIANTSTLDGMTFVASVDLGTTYPQLKDSNNKALTNSSVLVPTSSVDSKTMTLRTPSLALSLASTPASGSNTYVKGSKDIQYTGMVFACGAASDCRVTDMSLQGYLDDDGDASAFVTTATSTHTSAMNSYVGSVWLEDVDGNVVGAARSVNSSTFVVTYSNVNWTIDAGSTEILYVVGDISSNAYADTDGENLAFGISAASNVTVEDEAGNSFSATGTVNTAATTYVTTLAGGDLTVAVSSSTAKEDIAIAGSSDVEVSKFTLTSTEEAFVVSDLSINNRQSAVTTAALGDYDDNVSSLKISYENSDGDTETSTAYLVGGTANFSGLDLYVPMDETVTLTVYATLNTIAVGADAGTYVDLAMAMNNFKAVSQSSGDTYNAGKLDNDVAAASDLDIGTLTWVNGTHSINLAVAAIASSGSTQTLIMDNGAEATPINLPVGTLLCVSADTTCAFATESVFVVTGWTEGTLWTDGSLGDTVTTVVVNDFDTALANDDVVVYSLPGTGNFTATNRMHVYESKPTLALASSSPSGSRSVSTSDDAFAFSITAASQEKLQIRTAEVNNATANTTDFNATALAGTFTATDALSTVASGGIGDSAFQRETSSGTDAASIIYTFGAAADLSVYKGISFWTRASEAANTITLTIDDSTGTDQTVASGTMTAATWQFVNLSFQDIAAANLDVISKLTFAVTDASAVSGATYDIDRIVLYTEKITVDLASDASIDTFTTGGADNLVAYLKDSGTTVATGYVYSSTQTANASTAAVTFYPEAGVDSNIEIAKGDTKTLVLNLSTSALLNESTGVDDPLTFSITYGSSSDGTVTAGNFWWYETNATVLWMGKVSDSKLNSNTVKY